MTTFDYGPIEFYAIGFEGDRPGPGVLQAIDDLVVSGTVNVLDLVFARRSEDGELEVLELSDTIDDGDVPALDLAGLASDEDISELAEGLEPGTSAQEASTEKVAEEAAAYIEGKAPETEAAAPAPRCRMARRRPMSRSWCRC